MDLKQLIEKALKADGYDGLWWNGGGEETCGCKLGDLMWCDEPSMDCEAGYLMSHGENVGPGPRETEPSHCGECVKWRRADCENHGYYDYIFDYHGGRSQIMANLRNDAELDPACPTFKEKEK